MILFHSKTTFNLKKKLQYKNCIRLLLVVENKKEGEINFIFCDDEYLLGINKQYLQHDDLTDVITFDYSEKREISGDIFISIERVAVNAKEYATTFQEELVRVIVHGVLHLCGYKDKTATEIVKMRKKENNAIKYFHKLMFDK